MDSNDRLLSKGLLEARKHSENPILKNIQSGIYKAITIGGENAPPESRRGRIPAYIPKLMVIQKSLCIFNMHLPLAEQTLKVHMECFQSHQTLV